MDIEELRILCYEANGLDEEYLDEGWVADRVNDAKRFLKYHGVKLAVGMGAAFIALKAVKLAKKLGKKEKARLFNKVKVAAGKVEKKKREEKSYAGSKSKNFDVDPDDKEGIKKWLKDNNYDVKKEDTSKTKEFLANKDTVFKL